VTTVGGSVSLDECSDGAYTVGLLRSLTSVGGSLDLMDCYSTGYFDGWQVSSIGGRLYITNLENLRELPVSPLLSSVYDLSIYFTYSLDNLDELSGLRTVTSSIGIGENDSLNDVTALYGLTYVGGGVTLSHNAITYSQWSALTSAIDAYVVGSMKFYE
jgi:hypothetical protein